MSDVAAIVVTYNRKRLLKECLDSLLHQSFKTDIIVIDNMSTDGTKQMIQSLIDNNQIIYHCTGKNIGGAGGFSEGIKFAYKLGYNFFWIMDDDCIPEFSTLKQLMIADYQLKGRYGFLSSKTLWKNGEICKMNVQRKSMFKPNRDFQTDLVPICMASFVSLFFRRKIVTEFGLPIKEFFIWTDDWEFTRRISIKYKSYLVNSSIVHHKSASNIGANIATDSHSRLGRYKFLYRNDVFLYKREGIKGFFYELIRLIYHSAKILFGAPDSKMLRLKILFIGTLSGIKFNPKIEKI